MRTKYGHGRPYRKAPGRKHIYDRMFDKLSDLDGGAYCAYCGDYASCVDHVMPVSRGGPNIIDNFVLACDHCNRVKKGFLKQEYLTRGFYVVLTRGGSLDWMDTLP